MEKVLRAKDSWGVEITCYETWPILCGLLRGECIHDLADIASKGYIVKMLEVCQHSIVVSIDHVPTEEIWLQDKNRITAAVIWQQLLVFAERVGPLGEEHLLQKAVREMRDCSYMLCPLAV